ncbi:MAG: PEP-CTERM sorting domain-containing protein [Bryobacteraceae bacterium]|nr:PEP-CTERM sorting domain-containing protein [Bryobacteraceae bacterium]
MKRTLGLAGCFLLSLTLSHSSILVTLVSPGTPNGGPTGGTVFTYDIDITDETTVRHGDYFVIYDFGELLSSNFSLALGWDVGVTLPTGPLPSTLPPAQNPNDSPFIANVQIIRTGPDLVGPAFTGFPDLIFDLESPVSTDVNGSANLSAQFLNNGGTVGTTDDVETAETQDVAVPAATAAVPEPGTMGILGASLLGLAAFLRRRRVS